MANLEIQESNSRPDRIGAATYASLAASSWNANDMRSLFNQSQPANDITALFGNLDLFAGAQEIENGYIGVYKPGASPVSEKPENKDSAQPWELPVAPETAQRGGVIADNGNQARWQRAQEVHKLGQDESATDLYYRLGEQPNQSTNKFTIDGLDQPKQVNANGTPYTMRTLEASQAITKPGPLSETATQGEYQSSTKLTIQITNVPEVSAGLNPKEALHYASAVMEAGAQAVRQTENYLAKPDAINNDLLNLPNAAAKLADHLNPEQFSKDVQTIAAAGSAVISKLDKPMSPDERAKMAGGLLPMFFFEGGKEIDPNVARQLRLEQMTMDELKTLGIERAEMHMPEVPPDLRHLELSKVTPELIDAMKAKGREFQIAEPGSFLHNRLESLEVEASVFPAIGRPDLITLKAGGPKIAALEEFLHGTQSKIFSLAELPTVIREIHVKDFMLRHPALLGLTQNDMTVLESLISKEITKAQEKGWTWKK
ncbi:hypothetical protein BH10CYA1_BH10CYA1_63230 [soil metagenome]